MTFEGKTSRVFFYARKSFQIFFKNQEHFCFLVSGYLWGEKSFLLTDKWMTVRTEQTATTFFEKSERNLLKYELTAQRHRDM